MNGDKTDTTTNSVRLVSLTRGLYGRVARELDFDPSYVSRVARGERQSDVVEAAIEKEIRRIMRVMRFSLDGHKLDGHKLDGHNLNGHHLDGHRDGHGAKSKRKKMKKVLQ